MSKKRVILASSKEAKFEPFLSRIEGMDVELSLKNDLQSLAEALKKEVCCLILLGTFENGLPGKEDLETLISYAPRTPLVLVLPDGMTTSMKRYSSLPLTEIIGETELEIMSPRLIDRYVHSGFGFLREWSLDELFDYCFPVITTIDMDALTQIVIEFLRELLMADCGMLISPQEGRGLGFKLLHASGFHDISLVSKILTGYGNRILTFDGCEPDMFSSEEYFGDKGIPDGLADTKSVFTIKFDMDDIQPLYCVMFLQSHPHKEVLEGDVFRFFIRQVRFSLLNAEKNIKVQSLIYIDDLTKLYNARYLKVVLDRELKRSDRYKVPVSVLFLDIDYFKRVNDSYGHLVGSRVLCEFGDILRECVRETDTVVRYGGDEFVVILTETSPEQALLAAERMRKAVEEQLFMREENLDLQLTVSIGIATYPVHTKDRDQLLQMADKAMYRGKDSTRNVVYIAEA